MEKVVQGFSGVALLHNDLRQPCWQPILGPDDLRPSRHVRFRPNDPLLAFERDQKIQVLQSAAFRGVDVTICDCTSRGVPARDVRPRGNARRGKQRLLDQVDAPNAEVRLVHLAAAHTSIHLDQVRAMGSHFQLDMEDPVLEAEAFHGVDRQVFELLLLCRRQQRWAHGPSLIEVGLQGRPVVRHGSVAPIAAAHHDIDVDFGAIQVLLKEDRAIHDLVGVDARTAAIILDERSAGHHQALQLAEHLSVALLEFLLAGDLLDSKRSCARNGFQHGREAHSGHRAREVLRRLEQHILR
mmetsp:Transcript_132830/g.343671  ORF Transcript_132830/g.343671 Transcript_132830/m.343671 type:complete len:297 (+) Transcript_132830:497-1387(+)